MSFSLVRNEEVVLDGRALRVVAGLPNGHRLEDPRDGSQLILGPDDLSRAWSEGRLRRAVHLVRQPAVATDPPAELRPSLLASLDGGRSIVAALGALHRELGPPPYRNDDLNELAAKLKGAPGMPARLSRPLLRRWLAREREGRPLMPLPRRRRRALGAVDAIVQRIIDEAFMRPAPWSVASIHERIGQEVARERAQRRRRGEEPDLRAPSLATVYRRVADLDDEGVVTAQRGAKAASQRYGLFGGAPVETVPMGVIEIDHTRLDLIVVDEGGLVLGRPTLSIALCAATRMVVGFSLSWEHPGFSPVMQLLRHVIAPKPDMRNLFDGFVEGRFEPCGLPLIIKADRGAEMLSDNLRLALASLGNVHLDLTPPGEPHLKGKIERFFRTLNTRLIHRLPGTTMSTFARDVDAKIKPVTRACVTFHELNRLLHKFLVDVYPATYHRGLKARPIDAWRAGVASHPLRLPPHLSDLDVLAGGTEERVIGRRGVEFAGLFYASDELRELRVRMKGRGKVTVRYDAADVGAIVVVDADQERLLRVPCTSSEVRGRSLWQAKAIVAALGAERRAAATDEDLARARGALDDGIAGLASRRGERLRTKGRLARFASRPGTPTEAVAARPVDLRDPRRAFAMPPDEGCALDLEVEPAAELPAPAPAADPVAPATADDLDDYAIAHAYKGGRRG